MLLEQLDEIAIEPVARTARVGAAVTWERLVPLTGPHGLAVLAGEDLTRRAVEDTLAGAPGPLARTFGLAADHLLSVDLRTGDGALRTLTPEADGADLCALLNGARHLGTPVSMLMGLVPLTTLHAGSWRFAPVHASAASRVLQRWREWLDGLPESMSTRATLTAADGGLALDLRFAHVGDHGEGAALLAELRELVPAPARDTLLDLPPGPASRHLRERTPARGAEHLDLLDALPAAAVDGLVAAVSSLPTGTVAELRMRGGAVARPSISGCGVGGRDAAFALRSVAARQADADALSRQVHRWTR